MQLPFAMLPALHFAARYGGRADMALRAVEVLLAAGADRTAADIFGATPLHHAASNEDADAEVVRALLRGVPAAALPAAVGAPQTPPSCQVRAQLGALRKEAPWSRGRPPPLRPP